MSRARPLAAFASALAFLSLFLASPMMRLSAEPLSGQSNVPAQRVVHGRVEDKSGAVIKGAVVYLKDDRSSQVKSAISLDDGTFRFVQLSLNSDYELWAQLGAVKSKTKSISSFDSKSDITLDLKIE